MNSATTVITKPMVIVLEDVEDFQDAAREALTKAGYEVVVADSYSDMPRYAAGEERCGGSRMLTRNDVDLFMVSVVLSITTVFPIQNIAFAEDTSANAPKLASTDDVTGYIAKAKQAEIRLDFIDAMNWYQKAADLGDAKSMNEIGWIYFGSHDIPGRHLQDYAKAAIWFQKAADLNYVPAITQLGVMYNSDGSLGLPEDHTKAAQLYLKAAQAGDAQAMNNLGVMYSQGKGVPRDVDQAVYWWKKAVETDKNGPNSKAAQSWLDLHDGKPFCLYCPSTK